MEKDFNQTQDNQETHEENRKQSEGILRYILFSGKIYQGYELEGKMHINAN